MKHHPILFSTEMVEAILAGRKTMTRRIVTDRNSLSKIYLKHLNLTYVSDNNPFGFKAPEKDDPFVLWRVAPKWAVDDVLWVREAWNITDPDDSIPGEFLGPFTDYTGSKNGKNVHWRYVYKATSPESHPDPQKGKCLWKPSIHMPREACRLFLKVKSVKAQYLQDISEAEAIKEGIKPVQSFDSGAGISMRQMYDNYCKMGYRELLPLNSFESLWISINGPASWDSNPLVWVIEFERVEL